MNANKFPIFILAVIFILHSMPMLGIRYPTIIWASIVVLLFTILLYNVGIKAVLKIFPIFFIPLLDIFIKGNDISSYIWGISTFLPNMILPMLAIYLHRRNDVKMSGWLFFIYVVVNLITCFTTYWGCKMYPGASRDLAGGDASNLPFFNVYMNANIGGFGFVYSLVLFFVLTICTIKNHRTMIKGRQMLVIAIIFSIGIVMAVIAAEYTIAIIVTCLCSLLFFVRRKFNFKRILFWVISLLFIFSMFKLIIVEGLKIIADETDSYLLTHRLTDISLYLEGKHTQDNSDLDVRAELYTKSLTSFINNPLGGWTFNCMGGHSYIFDTLAKYGLIGFSFLIVSLGLIYSNYIKPLVGTFVYGYAQICFVVFIIFASLNPKVFTEFFLFVLPMYSLLFANRDTQKTFSTRDLNMHI